MRLLTTRPEDAPALVQVLRSPEALLVACLCAAWCDTCAAFREDFSRLAAERPACTFVWIDIEDDSDLAGDIDVENFPTLAIFRGEAPLFYGVSLPQAGVVARTVDALVAGPVRAVGVPPGVAGLPAALLECAESGGRKSAQA